MPDEDEEDEDINGGAAGAGRITCPYCRGMIYEGAEHCPQCGSYISEEDAPAGKPVWVIVVACALVIAIVVGWVMYGQ